MRLFHSPTSPYVRKVMVTLLETGQADGVTLVPAAGNPVDPGSMPVMHNPLGKIPALELPHGRVLYDSRVICRYLDARAGAGLYPSDDRLWDTLVIESTADGILDAAILMVYEERVRPEDKRFAGWEDGQWAKVSRALDTLQDRWMPHLQAPALDMGQIAVACALSYVKFRHAARDWRTGRETLADWHAGFEARATMQATQPPAG